jgi:peptidoglycan biosynthesis protein MviN/MurJ (putative lipid II flippase)
VTAQKTIVVIGVFTSLAAALLGAWGYARSGDGFSLLIAISFVFASGMGIVQLRRQGPSASSSFKPAGAGRSIAKFVGFACACWLVTLARVRGQSSPLIDPLNVLVLLTSLTSLVLGLYFALRLREARRMQGS